MEPQEPKHIYDQTKKWRKPSAVAHMMTKIKKDRQTRMQFINHKGLIYLQELGFLNDFWIISRAHTPHTVMHCYTKPHK